MAYTITNTSGATLVSVPDGEINTTQLDLSLIGKNYSGYGNVQNHNFVKLLENFASTTAPIHPIEGQLWWKSDTNEFNVYVDGSWKVLSRVETKSSTPTAPQAGDLWFNTTTQQLNVYNGTTWIVVGPDYTVTQGVSGVVPASVWDGGSPPTQRTILKFVVGGSTLGIISDASYTLHANSAISGFSSLSPGLTLSSITPFPQLNGYAPIASPTFTGAPKSSASLPPLDSTSNLATTAFTTTAIATAIAATGGDVTSVQNNVNLLRVDVGTLIGNVNSRFTAVNNASTGTNLAVTSVNSVVNTFTGNVDSRFLAVNTAITSNVSRLDSTLTTFIGNVNSRFTAVNNASTGTNLMITNLSARIDNLVVPDTAGFARLTGAGGATQTFSTPIIFSTAIQVPPKDKETNTSEAASTSMVQSLVADRQPMWGTSRKFVSTNAPSPSDGSNGDFWFQIAP
jgi:hypothetical protein